MRNRCRHTVATTVSHTFYTAHPLSEDKVAEMERRVEAYPTDSEGVVDSIYRASEYDREFGILSDFGQPSVTSQQVSRGNDGTLMQISGDDDAEVPD